MMCCGRCQVRGGVRTRGRGQERGRAAQRSRVACVWSEWVCAGPGSTALRGKWKNETKRLRRFGDESPMWSRAPAEPTPRSAGSSQAGHRVLAILLSNHHSSDCPLGWRERRHRSSANPLPRTLARPVMLLLEDRLRLWARQQRILYPPRSSCCPPLAIAPRRTWMLAPLRRQTTKPTLSEAVRAGTLIMVPVFATDAA